MSPLITAAVAVFGTRPTTWSPPLQVDVSPDGTGNGAWDKAHLAVAAAVGTALSGVLLSPLQLLTKVWPAAQTDGLLGFGLGGAMRVMDQVRGMVAGQDGLRRRAYDAVGGGRGAWGSVRLY